ncbi:MAG: hypothetical protein P8M14_07185 [Flavobacteriaceae bacterium]|nr:hypothetical protein [Flavobacteriaceae bacterium]MDG2445215.1 hypothetical protein [Flavobacteriaceae bacterium]
MSGQIDLQSGIKQLQEFPEEQPVFMLNYLNYKETVAETGKTGKETYADYLKAAVPFFNTLDAEIIFKGSPLATIIGPSDESLWDEVLIVRYANKNEFMKLMAMKDYPRALRSLALSDSRLILCK